MSTATISNNGGGNGWFSNLISDVAGSAGSTVKELLPIWAANQLNLQSRDQLNRDTYTGAPSANLNPPLATTANPAPATESTAPMPPSFASQYGIPIAITAALIGTAILVKLIK